MIELDVISAMPFGQFETAEWKSDHVSWDVSYPNVGYAIPHEIISYEPSDLSEIRSTEITNVETASALHLVSYAPACVPVATHMA